jgi:hypothetical protein
VVAGAALLWRVSRRFAAASLTILYGIFALFPLPRFYTAPHFLGYRAPVYIGVLGSVCQEIILFIAAVVVWKSVRTRFALAPSGSVRSLDVWALLGRFRPRTPHCH